MNFPGLENFSYFTFAKPLGGAGHYKESDDLVDYL